VQQLLVQTAGEAKGADQGPNAGRQLTGPRSKEQLAAAQARIRMPACIMSTCC
jgi:hypothetical protein